MTKLKNESTKDLQRTMDVIGFQEYHRRRTEGLDSISQRPVEDNVPKWLARKRAAKKLLEYIRNQTNDLF